MGGVNLYKIWKRVICPFIITQIIIFLLLVSITSVSISDYISIIKKMGGYGPGEYYPWIYVQIALIVPAIRLLNDKIKTGAKRILFFILLSQGLEFISIMFKIPDWPYYSILFFRYTFLIYLGYKLAYNECVINVLTILLSILSILVTIYFCFCRQGWLNCFFVTETQWKYCHWICYYYIFYWGIGGFYFLWNKIKPFETFKNFLKKVGKFSYEIFLFQMIWFSVFYPRLLNILLGAFNLELVAYLFAITISLIICIIPVIICKEIKSFSLYNK